MLQKTFYKTLLEFSLDPSKAKKCLQDKRLTLTEKKIVEAWLLIRNNQNDEAVKYMRALPPSEYEFVEGQRKLVLGHALNSLSHYAESEKFIKEALAHFEAFEVPYFKFIGNLLLFTIYSNRNLIPEMFERLQAMEKLPHESELQEIKLLRCQFDYYALVDEAKARTLLAEIEKHKSGMTEGDITAHLICEFMFFVSVEELDRCELILEQMKSYRKFNLTENFNFMKKALAHLNHNAPIYLYGDDFKAVPILYDQLRVIQSFEESNMTEAKNYWDKLHARFPETYAENFQYNGSKCLFSLCLQKHLKPAFELITTEKPEFSSKLDLLIDIMSRATTPVPKGQLYECLWGTHPEDKADMTKLTKLISRARSEHGFEIKTRKGTYYVEKIPEKKKIAN